MHMYKYTFAIESVEAQFAESTFSVRGENFRREKEAFALLSLCVSEMMSARVSCENDFQWKKELIKKYMVNSSTKNQNMVSYEARSRVYNLLDSR